MTLDEAMTILRNITESVQTNLATHMKIQEALQVVSGALPKPEQEIVSVQEPEVIE